MHTINVSQIALIRMVTYGRYSPERARLRLGFDVMTWTRRRGAIAQLGERLLCKQEVGGSIPPGSTINRLSSGLP